MLDEPGDGRAREGRKKREAFKANQLSKTALSVNEQASNIVGRKKTSKTLQGASDPSATRGPGAVSNRHSAALSPLEHNYVLAAE